MKREIKFRGKTQGGRLIYGDLITYESGQAAIIENQLSEYGYEATQIARRTRVDPDSVGQFTGLKDKNGVEIYEGDIVRWDDCSNGRHWRIAIVRINPDIQFDCSLGLSYDGMKSSSKDIFRFGNFIYKDTHNHLEVVGNVFDNPELLKGGSDD